ncbi:MAG: sulfate adenylyltransferase [Candidatus Sumerlaeaceae bacterium]|nr:sulfate adenylyltransferase [Candidatus Sumerlaeaceae bacterium]
MPTSYQPAPLKQIAPHGGVLVNRVLEGAAREDAIKKAAKLAKVTVNEWEMSDIEIIGVGALSPLTGFMTPDEFDSVVDEMKLPNGLPWTLPVTVSVAEAQAGSIKEGDEVGLYSPDGQFLAIQKVVAKYKHNKAKEALKVYGTDELNHPGVAALYKKGEYLLGGPIEVVNLPPHNDFLPYRLTPAQTREEFKKRNWRRIVAFQTRNPIHRAHEYMTKVAMEITDGLLLHPLMGVTKDDDVSAELRMETYEAIVGAYYPKDRVIIAVNPSSMRYAGPREAVFHAILRKNYGCTHFIVGRDHAGVGNYYGSFDAHYIFDYFDPAEIGITPLFFDYTFFCKKSGGMASVKTSAGTKEDHITLSGTKVREMLRAGEMPPPEFTRPEVAKILIRGMKTTDEAANI